MVRTKPWDILSGTLLDCLELEAKINYMNQIRKYVAVFKLLALELDI